MEELYDTSADPDNVNNLIDDPKYAKDIARLSAQLNEWQLKHFDSGIRYWAVVGIFNLSEGNKLATAPLKKALTDDSHHVRIIAAWVLYKKGMKKEAQGEKEESRLTPEAGVPSPDAHELGLPKNQYRGCSASGELRLK